MFCFIRGMALVSIFQELLSPRLRPEKASHFSTLLVDDRFPVGANEDGATPTTLANALNLMQTAQISIGNCTAAGACVFVCLCLSRDFSFFFQNLLPFSCCHLSSLDLHI
jgi:hypothetical protein